MKKSLYSSVATFVRKQAKLRRCIASKGGRCERCGRMLLDEPWNVQFHHKNKQKKEIGISQILSSTIDQIEIELKKCELLCNTCHKLTHFRGELYEKHYKEICEQSEKKYTPGRWSVVDTKIVYDLLNEGKSVQQIAVALDRSQRVIRKVIRRLEKQTGKKLIPDGDETYRIRTEMANKKITDEQLLESLAAKRTKSEIIKMYGVGNHTLNIRIGKLVQEGRYQPTQPAQVAKILKTMEKAKRRYKKS